MADRRMLTKKVTDDDRFTELSASAQALYLHLSMSADDDGFCNQVAVSMFKAHASVQDLQALLERRYLYQFDTGVIVIKHWRMANALRKDRYTPTAFKEEFAQLRLKDNGAYTLTDDGCQLVANWLPDGCPSIDKERLDKNRLDKEMVVDIEAATASGLIAYASNNLTYISPTNMQELDTFREDLSEDMIRYAIDEACANGKRTYAYVRSILNRMIERGFKTLGEVKAAEAERKAKQTAPVNVDPAVAQNLRKAQYTRRPMDERTDSGEDDVNAMYRELMNRPRSGA